MFPPPPVSLPTTPQLFDAAFIPRSRNIAELRLSPGTILFRSILFLYILDRAENYGVIAALFRGRRWRGNGGDTVNREEIKFDEYSIRDEVLLMFLKGVLG